MIRKFCLWHLLLLTGLIFTLSACKSDVDTDLPYILLDGPNPFYIDSIGGQYVEPGFKGLDDIDGDLTSAITVTYPVIATDSAKSYQVIYSLSDKSGNVNTTFRTVIVRNTAWFLEGFYPKSIQYCDSDTAVTFAATIQLSTVLNNEFYISNFANFGQPVFPSKGVICSVDQTTGKINISTPQTLADSSNLDFVNADSTYVIRTDTTAFQVYFIRTLNGVIDSCHTIYRK